MKGGNTDSPGVIAWPQLLFSTSLALGIVVHVACPIWLPHLALLRIVGAVYQTYRHQVRRWF